MMTLIVIEKKNRKIHARIKHTHTSTPALCIHEYTGAVHTHTHIYTHTHAHTRAHIYISILGTHPYIILMARAMKNHS